MATRKGMGKGKGMGYKNIIPKDKSVHSMSARGMKQPQRHINLNFKTRPRMIELTGTYFSNGDIRTKGIWIDESDLEVYKPQELRNKYNFISIDSADYVDKLTKKPIKNIIKIDKKERLIAFQNWIKDNPAIVKQNRNVFISYLAQKGNNMDIFKAIEFVDNLR